MQTTARPGALFLLTFQETMSVSSDIAADLALLSSFNLHYIIMWGVQTFIHTLLDISTAKIP